MNFVIFVLDNYNESKNIQRGDYMTLEEMTQNTNPYLLCWIDLALTPKHLTDISQLRRIKRLADKDFPVPYSSYTEKKLAHIQDYLKSGTGDWALLGEMTNLQVLEFPKRTPSGIIDDFSFLPKLKNLYRLSLQFTGFTDCSLLSGLTKLKSLALPARKKLIHTEVLDTLSCEIYTNEPAYCDNNFPKYKVVPAQEATAPSPDTFTACYLEYGRKHFSNNELTQEVLNELAEQIRDGKITSLLLSLDENGEEDFFTMDIEKGWAAPLFNSWNEDGDAVCFQPINEKYAGVEEDAPVEIGGQSPVPKRFALDDLELAAECAVYFAKTGKLYPAVQWAEFS